MTKQAELKQQAYACNLKSRAISILIYLIDFPIYPDDGRAASHICIYGKSSIERASRRRIYSKGSTF